MQLRVIDSYEMMAKSAMANRYAHHANQAKERKIFDKEKALRSLSVGSHENKLNPNLISNASRALKYYEVKFIADAQV